jgi:hypothetical protein
MMSTSGQTGSGKTYTVLGDWQHPGLLFLAVQDLLSEPVGDLSFCFYEIYQGHLYDLLARRRKLSACEQDGQVKILGLKHVLVMSVEHVKELVAQAMDLRRVGSTLANDQSSRSHAIMQFSHVHSANSSSHNTGVAKLTIVDLAGSERALDRDAGVSPTSKHEASEINKSLLALKECIRAMDGRSAYLPFRSSKLTQVLRDAFVMETSGSEQDLRPMIKTCMIATVNPSASNYEVSLNTLRYADRVKELSPSAEAGGEEQEKTGLQTPSKMSKTSHQSPLLKSRTISQHLPKTASQSPHMGTITTSTSTIAKASKPSIPVTKGTDTGKTTVLTTPLHQTVGGDGVKMRRLQGLRQRIERCMQAILGSVDAEISQSQRLQEASLESGPEEDILQDVLEELTVLSATLHHKNATS